MPASRWLVEGDDAAVLAQAIHEGTLTRELQSFKDFFDPESGGPGASIGEKYNHHTPRGRRNLQLNWIKLYDKIQLWKANKGGNNGKSKFFCLYYFFASHLLLSNSYSCRRSFFRSIFEERKVSKASGTTVRRS